MKIVVITQEDYHSISENVSLLNEAFPGSIELIVQIENNGRVLNKKLLFLRGFGFFQCLKLYCKITIRKISAFLDFVCLFSIFNGQQSLFNIARRHKFKYLKVRSVNNKQTVDLISEMDTDYIISFSAPEVFKKEILSLPKQACLNLHCSPLPLYAGLMPSFWMLNDDEKNCGVSVHLMDNKIDNGRVVAQQRFQQTDKISLTNFITKSKSIGGKLMIKAIKDMENGKFSFDKDHKPPSKHYTWPTIDEIKKFKKKGGKLI